MNQPSDQHRDLLARVAREAMIEYGLEPEFPARGARRGRARWRTSRRTARVPPTCADCSGAPSTTTTRATSTSSPSPRARWTAAVRVLVAIADVSAAVVPGSAVDAHAGVNTTSVYTPGRIFPMLPDRLSTDLTSLNPAEDRLAVVVGMTVDAGGAVVAEDVRRALVHNHAKLAYPSVGAWLQGEGEHARGAGGRARASPRTCGCRTRWRSGCGRAATNRARSSSRPSRCAPASTATPSAASPSSAATAPRSSSRTS